MSGAMTERYARRVALLRRAYGAFDRREIEAVLALLTPDVEWPNVLAGTTLRGRDAVRAYWVGQFETLDPRVEPEAFVPLGQDGVVAAVHQVVRDRDGHLLSDSRVAHAYTFRGELAARMAVYPTVDAARSAGQRTAG
jgi:ketosteroid isomerase-like protein